MDVAAIQGELIRLRRARNNLFLVAAFTTVGIFLMTFGLGTYMFYSAALPRWMMILSLELVEETGESIYYIMGMLIGLAVVLPYLVLGLLAKRFPVCILPAFIYFALDSLFLLLLAIGGELWVGLVPDLILHAIILFTLFGGVCAWRKLRWVDRELVAQVAEGMKAGSPTVGQGRTRRAATEMFGEELLTREREQPATAQAATGAGTATMAVENRSNPLRLDDKKNRTLVAAEYSGMEISMKRSWALTELVVDGYVYDEIQGSIEMKYTLAATVQGVRITGTYDPILSRMVLAADGKPIAKKLRFY